MLEWIQALFSAGGFRPQGYTWRDGLIGLDAGSDVAIGVSCILISLTLVYLAREAGREIPFSWIFIAFGAFLAARGAADLMEIRTLWTPAYRLPAGVKPIAALAAIFTAAALPELVPKTIALVRNARLSEQRKEELSEANDKLARVAAIVEFSNDAIVGIAPDCSIASWNPAAERMYGYRAAEVRGRSVSMLTPPPEPDKVVAAIGRVKQGERVEPFEAAQLHKNGEAMEAHLAFSPIRNAAGEWMGVSMLARDVTERKRAEKQLREAQKLESLGLIAGGVAHDFNNLLAGIMGNASHGLEGIGESDPLRPYLSQVVRASERAALLTRQLLAFAGRGRVESEKIDLSAAVRDIAELIRTTIPKGVELRLDLAGNLPPVEAEPSQLQQLVMNLVINGAEAIGEGAPGVVQVSTRLMKIPSNAVSPAAKPLPVGRYLSLEVRDSGCGMSEETLARIFDPFFTTKFSGRGLGLSAARGIVEAHGGSLRVRSAPGKGSTFTVLLPAVSGQAVKAEKEAEVDLRGAGMALVVDDEEIVRTMAKKVLERHGYTVLLAADGALGLEAMRAGAERVSIALLDLTMPGMNGVECLRQLRLLRPDLPVVISSGYSEEDISRKFSGGEVDGFIQKPYTAAKLLAKIKSTLAAGGHAARV